MPSGVLPLPATDPLRESGWRADWRAVQILTALAIFGAVVVGAIGFGLSFTNLSAAAEERFGFTPDGSDFFALGVDAGIITFLALDLCLSALRMPWPLLRVLAHAMTLASVYFNAAGSGSIMDNPARAAAHGLMPVLFVIGVEAGRRALVHRAKLPGEHDTIPLRRWLLAPITTPSIFRTMKIWELSYSTVLKIRREQRIHKVWAKHEQDFAEDLTSPQALASLIKELAPVGMSPAEAMSLPAAMARAEQRRRQDEERERERLADEAAQAEHEKEMRAIAREAEKAEAAAELIATRGVSQARAEGAVAEAETEAGAITEAARKRAEAVAAVGTAEEQARIAEADARAAEARRAEAEQDARALRIEEENTRRRSETKAAAQRAAESARSEAEARRAAAEADARAAEARRAAAEADARATLADDFAALSSTDRKTRRVARLLARADVTGGELTNAEIAAAIGGASEGTASGYRAKARALLESGYDPAADLDQGALLNA
ncbi:DUF2637 domain-containing protein [Streptomyces sp. DSM 41982]|uniref:DUF2637 domain-containing protein n=1 Tax=Streptomyces evansiae TaxID=3075535 RepID=A0ABD5EBT5_9ACTN|nr:MULTISPECIES: DUF2637 domain-containing protein [unclassified Streptomyces]MDT0418864.1 DUF2637 domain-containing protein [Streptomyces sp. DSM 41982]SCD62307.1 Protein of unknown function [Streptomyces sp. SolWspMP-sol7th]